YPPPKQGWPDVLERVRLWGAPWPPPAAPSSSSSSPLGERIEVRGSHRAPVPPRNDAQAETPPLPSLSPRGEVMTAPAKLGDASLSLRNLLPQQGEGQTSVGRVNEGAPPLFSPHLPASSRPGWPTLEITDGSRCSTRNGASTGVLPCICPANQE